MVHRHRIPTIFNLSMVDVLCCALGCVILLWLLNLRDAKQRAEAAGQTNELLARARSQLSSSEEQAQKLAAALSGMTDARNRQAIRAEDAEKALTALQQLLATTDEQLAQKTAEQVATAKELSASRQRVAALGQMVKDKEDELQTAVASADDLSKRLQDADTLLKQSTAQADLVPGLRGEVQMTREKLAAADAAAAGLRKELDARKQDLAGASVIPLSAAASF